MPPKLSKALSNAYNKARENVEQSLSPVPSTSDNFERKPSSRSPLTPATAEVSYASTRNVVSDRYLPAARAPSKTLLDSPEIQECRNASSNLVKVSKKNLFEGDHQIFEYDKAEKVMNYQSQRRRSIHSQISDMATTRTAITKVDAAKRSAAYNDILFDVCGVMLELKGARFTVLTVRHGSLAAEGNVVNGHELLSVDFNKDSPEYGRAEGQDVKGLTLEGICELIAGAPDLDPGLIGFENPEDEVVIKKHGTQLRFRAQPMHHQISVNSDKMKEKIMALRNTAKNIGIHEGLILRNCWTLFQDMNHSGTGHLSAEDLLFGVREVLKLKANEEQISEMFTAADVNDEGAISFQDFKDTVVQLISTEHFPERFTPWLFTKQRLINVLCAPDRRTQMDALRPWVVVTAAVHCLGVASLLGVSLSRWREEEKSKEQWDGLEQDEVRLLRGVYLILCLIVAFGGTVLSLRRSSPVGMSIAFMLDTAMAVWSVINAVENADIARANGERRGEIVLALLLVCTGTLLSSFMCMILIRISCFVWFREKVNAEIRHRMQTEIPKRTTLSIANSGY